MNKRRIRKRPNYRQKRDNKPFKKGEGKRKREYLEICLIDFIRRERERLHRYSYNEEVANELVGMNNCAL